MKRSASVNAARASLAAVVVVSALAGCGESRIDRMVAAADAYVRAVYVDRNCAAAARMWRPAVSRAAGRFRCRYRHPTGWGAAFGAPTFLIRGSRRVLHRCGRIYDGRGAAPKRTRLDCVRYLVVSRGRNPSSGNFYDYSFSDVRVFVGTHGADKWKIVGWSSTFSEGCVGSAVARRSGCSGEVMWVRRVRLHDTGPI